MIDVRIITELLYSSITFNPAFAAFAKIAARLLAAGMLLSQIFYWAKTKNFEEFYKVSEELKKRMFFRTH